MPKPNPQEWADAYSYCSLDPHFESSPSHREAVRNYIKAVEMLDDEKDEINRGALDFAKKWANVKTLNVMVNGFMNLALERLPLISRSACLSKIADSKSFAGAIDALKATVRHLTFTVRREVTQNAGGTVTISISILEDPKQDAQEAVLFALAHELGHSADFTLNPYNKSESRRSQGAHAGSAGHHIEEPSVGIFRRLLRCGVFGVGRWNRPQENSRRRDVPICC